LARLVALLRDNSHQLFKFSLKTIIGLPDCALRILQIHIPTTYRFTPHAIQRTQHPQSWPHHHPQRSHHQAHPPSPSRANAPDHLSPSQTAPQHPNRAANPPQQARPHHHTLYAKPRSHRPKATGQITMQCTRPKAVPTSATRRSQARSRG
jgi:hypothetical protein